MQWTQNTWVWNTCKTAKKSSTLAEYIPTNHHEPFVSLLHPWWERSRRGNTQGKPVINHENRAFCFAREATISKATCLGFLKPGNRHGFWVTASADHWFYPPTPRPPLYAHNGRTSKVWWRMFVNEWKVSALSAFVCQSSRRWHNQHAAIKISAKNVGF